MEGSLAELFVVLSLKDNLSGGINESTGKLTQFASSAAGVAIGVGVLSDQIGTTVDRFKTLDSAAQVTALQTGNTAEEMKVLIDGLYSADTSLEESAALFEALGKAGLKSTEDLKTAGDAFDSLGDAIGTPGAALVETLVPAFKAFGIEVADAAQYTDGLTTMFMTTGVSASEFGTAITRMAPKLAENGLSMQAMETALIGLSDKGIKGRLAMQELAKGIDESADANKDGIISTEEFMAAVGLTGEQVAAASKKLSDSAGATQKYADAQNAGISASEGFAVQLDKVGIALGGVVAPVGGVLAGLGSMSGAITTIGGSVTILQSVSTAMTAMSSGSVIAGLSGLSTSILGVGASMTAALIPALIAAAPIILGIGIALVAIYALNELGVFDWIIEQGAAFGEWIRNFDIAAAFQGIIDFFTNLPQTIMNALGGNGGANMAQIIVGVLFPPLGILLLLNQFFPQIGEWFADIGNKVIAILTSIDPVNVVLGIIGLVFPPARILAEMGIGLDDIIKFLTDMPGKLISTLASINPTDVIIGIIEVIFPVIKLLDELGIGLDDILDWFSDIPRQVLDAIVGAAIGVAKFVDAIFPVDDILKFLTDGFNNILGGAVQFAKDLIQAFKDIADGIIKPVNDLYDTIKTKLSDLWTFIKGIWEDVAEAFDDIVSKIPLIGGGTGNDNTDTLNGLTPGPGIVTIPETTNNTNNSTAQVVITGDIYINANDSADVGNWFMDMARNGQIYRGVI